MGKLLLGIVGLVAAFILIMFVLAIVHVLFLYAFFIAAIAIAARSQGGPWSAAAAREN